MSGKRRWPQFGCCSPWGVNAIVASQSFHALGGITFPASLADIPIAIRFPREDAMDCGEERVLESLPVRPCKPVPLGPSLGLENAPARAMECLGEEGDAACFVRDGFRAQR